MAKDGIPKLQVTPPNHLDPVAKQEYKRIIASLGTLPLRNLDRAELENYCTWYSVYKNTSVNMKLALKNGDQDEYYAYISTLNKATGKY
jgi:phage terminase small subunit